MKKALNMLLLAAAALAMLISCTDGARVIPVRKMQKIYSEMFLADQWLIENPSKKGVADSTWFYEPIFEKYGYNSDDYRKSVNYYLNDPERYASMMRKVRGGLQKETDRLFSDLDQRRRMIQKADSIARVLSIFAPKDLSSVDYYRCVYVSDSISVEMSGDDVPFIKSVPRDTAFKGPALIIKDTSICIPSVEEPLHRSLTMTARDTLINDRL